MIQVRALAVAACAVVATCFAAPAIAASEPSTRLVSCGAESCLLVRGYRDSARAEVSINGHPVDVQGGRNWRVRLPMQTVRDWAAPFARRIEVSTRDALADEAIDQQASLPIGLLGHAPDLASLIITLH